MERDISVYTASLSAGRLVGAGFAAPCALGERGVIAAGDKREGDKASPTGCWPVRKAWWRPDRLERPQTSLVIDPLTENDGWCDDPGDPAYNRPVLKPYPASHESLWREDGLYDIIVMLGHNDDPPVPGLGSAIFLHCALPAQAGGLKPTLGCVAIPRDHLVFLLSRLKAGDGIAIAR
ncbi:MAG: L,D-transpeptidase [Oceanicaulis sp.]